MEKVEDYPRKIKIGGQQFKIGDQVKVTTKRPKKPFARMCPTLPLTHVMIGQWIDRADGDPKGTIRLHTNDVKFDEPVVDLRYVIAIEKAKKPRVQLSSTDWQRLEKPKKPNVIEHKVRSSDGKRDYTVTQTGNKWECNCPASMFRKGFCKHIGFVIAGTKRKRK